MNYPTKNGKYWVGHYVAYPKFEGAVKDEDFFLKVAYGVADFRDGKFYGNESDKEMKIINWSNL